MEPLLRPPPVPSSVVFADICTVPLIGPCTRMTFA
jgi:hypothetical protein